MPLPAPSSCLFRRWRDIFRRRCSLSLESLARFVGCAFSFSLLVLVLLVSFSCLFKFLVHLFSPASSWRRKSLPLLPLLMPFHSHVVVSFSRSSCHPHVRRLSVSSSGPALIITGVCFPMVERSVPPEVRRATSRMEKVVLKPS